MNGNQPIGGQWNYDLKNRKPPKENLLIPDPYHNHPDDITLDVMSLVAEYFPDHFGDLEPFYFGVTRLQALEALDLFLTQRLPNFGDYQDAILILVFI